MKGLLKIFGNYKAALSIAVAFTLFIIVSVIVNGFGLPEIIFGLITIFLYVIGILSRRNQKRLRG